MAYHTGNELIDPFVLLDKAQLHTGMHVADFGCGRTGQLIFPAANIVGERGVVYAVDILKDVLHSLESRMRSDAFINIHPVWADVERVGKTAIPPHSVDAIFIVNMLFQSKKQTHILDECERLLKDKGRIIIVDWKTADPPFAPQDDLLVSFDTIRGWASEHEFVVQEEFDAGRYHHGIVLFRQQ